MENAARRRDCSAHEDRPETCESLYQSVGYDSGICLSNYRSTGDPCGAPGLLSRDSDALVSGLLGLQLRNDVESSGSAAAFDVVQPGSAPEVFPVNGRPTCQLGGVFYEDQLYQQDEEGDTYVCVAILLNSSCLVDCSFKISVQFRPNFCKLLLKQILITSTLTFSGENS